MPSRSEICRLPNRLADVWLRKNIVEVSEDGEAPHWEADEVYFRTSLSDDMILDNFDELYDNHAVEVRPVTQAERLDAIEALLIDLMEVFEDD